MKLKTIALCIPAAFACAAPALAQQAGSTVTIYGILDNGFEWVNHASAGSGNSARVSNGKGTSHWGLRGSENLGNGLKAIFNLEQGLTLDTGVMGHGGRMFGRQSYVGLQSDDFGRLTFGRQFTMKWWATRFGNVFGTGAHGLPTLDEGVGNPRHDNAILWLSPVMKGFQVGASYSFGRDAVNGPSQVASNCAGEITDGTTITTSKECRSISAMGSYDHSGAWGVAMGYERNVGGANSWAGSAFPLPAGGITNHHLSDKRFIMSGYFKVDKARIGLGWIKRNNEGLGIDGGGTAAMKLLEPKSNLYWTTWTTPVVGNFGFDGLLAHIRYDHSYGKATVLTLRPDYKFSRRTSVYLSANFVRNSGKAQFAATTTSPKVSPEVGDDQLSVIAGLSHAF